MLAMLALLSSSTAPLVQAPSLGAVRGVRAPSGGANFFGIPFAQPPIGALRFKSPQPPPDARHGAAQPFDATEMKHNCLQNPSASFMGWPQPLSTQSEDCLYLNVFTGPPQQQQQQQQQHSHAPNATDPALPPATRAPPAALAPVLVWIYGGGYRGGGANETRLNGTWSAALMAGELVVVTFNYRLNVFGFAAAAALAAREGGGAGTGNYGILDQRAAMAWVGANIGAFGGDPKRVLIVGQSAGASSVSQHLVRPASWPYFSAAGMESGAFYDGMYTPTVAQQAGAWDDLATYLGCDRSGAGGAGAVASCVAAADATRLLNSTIAGRINSWSPTIDGVELAAPGPALAAAGKIAKVPVFAGWVREDISGLGNPACDPKACGRDDFVTLVAAATGANATAADAVAELYAAEAAAGGRPGSNGSGWYWAAKHAGARVWAGCPARLVARWAAAAGQRAWWYR